MLDIFEKSIIVNTENEKVMELSYPKLISKVEMEYTYIKGITSKSLKDYFPDVVKIENISTGLPFKYDEDGRISLKHNVFVTKNNEKLVLKANAIRKENDYIITFKTVDFSSGKVLNEFECNIEHEDKLELNRIFKSACDEIKRKISELGKTKIFIFSPKDALNEGDFLKESVCVGLDNCNTDVYGVDKRDTYLDEKYLEKLLDACISKEYGFEGILESSMEGMTRNSKYVFDGKKILSQIKQMDNRMCSFELDSVLIKK